MLFPFPEFLECLFTEADKGHKDLKIKKKIEVWQSYDKLQAAVCG